MANQLLVTESSTHQLRIEIRNQRMPILVYHIMLGLIGFCGLALLLFFSIFGFKAMGLPTLVIYAATTIYLVRLFLWNAKGKEIYIFRPNELEYYYDYGMFQDHKEKLEFETLFVDVWDEKEEVLFEINSNLQFNPNELILAIDIETDMVYSHLYFEYTDELLKIQEWVMARNQTQA